MLIGKCPRCGEPHDVELRPFRGDNRNQWRWFLCPKLDEPAMIRWHADGLMNFDDELLSMMQIAHHSSQWMVCVWRVEDGLVKLDRRTMNFPKVDFNECVRLLIGQLEDEAGPPKAAPLEQAGDMEPTIQLFEGGG